MNINPTSRFYTLLKWFVPVAATFAFAAWMYLSPEGALGKLDAIGYAVCHRIDVRSFQIDDRQLPLCARCTGEFYAAGVALLFQVFVSGKRSKLPSRGMIAVLFLFFLAFGVDGSNSYLYLLKQTSSGALDKIPNLYVPNNTLRLFTGSGMGIALAAMLYPVINQTLWRNLDDQPALEWKSLGGLIALVVVLNLLILTDSPIVLYPIAYISALGTLSLLVIVFAILWIMIMRQDNSFETPSQLWLPFLSGLTLALLMILSIDMVRLQFTGTWSGFPGMTG
ncbi:MAG TPA: DUF2085 domain-containing protein [Anaerolineales bacterium]|nr:DUF2085 domain-containing protein [Anaerolineales bacterium]HMZ44936.1 DUF2085 domain-containing protein [Anaerolineales bacterium]HNA56240.1 DUF2085 domain-containing protein [Anaerolineales bacterium]HNB88509.1 DUF2085 domain-containing protein [Anaerolineales bacterium]HNC91142.1 DUF2085 domain-containing protein [Anaerolineales bacterium]